MNILIFEDEFHHKLSPLSLIKPVYDIRTGVFTNAERLALLVREKHEILYHCRNLLYDYVSEIKEKKVNSFDLKDTLFINGRIIFKKSLLEKLFNFKNEFLWKSDEVIIAAYFSAANMSKFNSLLASEQGDFLAFEKFINDTGINVDSNESIGFFPKKDFYVLNYSWDIVKYFPFIINEDLELLSYNQNLKNILDYKIINPESVYISESAKILPYCVLDASAGKIFIGDEVQIEPFTYIKGPVYIGSKSIIKAESKIYGPVSIGYNSRIAGECSGTIFHSFVNKQHDGFIGNSYVAEFVNLGADTVTSNLKNNYSPIKARYQKDSIQYQTGLSFFGSIIGDHTKTGINTMLNTGSIIGIFALIAGGGFPDKFIDSFSWYITGKPISKYKIDEALHTAKIVMNRRQVELTPAYEKLIRNVYKAFIDSE